VIVVIITKISLTASGKFLIRERNETNKLLSLRRWKSLGLLDQGLPWKVYGAMWN